MLKILPFIRILYLKQQNSILRCFSRLKFEKSLFGNVDAAITPKMPGGLNVQTSCAKTTVQNVLAPKRFVNNR